VSIVFRQSIGWAIENHPDEFEQMFFSACRCSYQPMMLQQPGTLGVDTLVKGLVGYEYSDTGRSRGFRIWAWAGKSAKTLAKNSTWDQAKTRTLLTAGVSVTHTVADWLKSRGWTTCLFYKTTKEVSMQVLPPLTSAGCLACPNYLACVVERG
jgi:hypothetical protein